MITGGSSGIGAGSAAAYHAAGAEVTITGTGPSAADYAEDLSNYRYLALDVTDEDPVGQEPCIGTAAIHRFFETGYKQVNGEMLMRPEGEVRVAERHAACAMIVDCAKADEPFWIATLDVFSFREDGLITGMQAYWGANNFHPLPSPTVLMAT